jgi:thymidylate synthase (FAD)
VRVRLSPGVPVTKINVLDHGFVQLRNIAGPTRRQHEEWDADDVDPAEAARMSFNKGGGNRRDQDLKLCRYLMEHRHSSPFEMVEIWLEMKLPIFVARQFVRHRTISLNEVSGRYVTLPAEWYIPRPEHVGTKPGNIKQGRVIDGTVTGFTDRFISRLNGQCATSYAMYEVSLQEGIPPEVARMLLHLNHYTHWLWKQDLHNILHFLSLRIDSHAQYEAQEYGRAIVKLLNSVLPETMKMWEEYNGH